MIIYSPLVSLGRIYTRLPVKELKNTGKISECRLKAEQDGKLIAQALKKSKPEINLDTVQVDPYQYIAETEQMEYLISARTIPSLPQYHPKPK